MVDNGRSFDALARSAEISKAVSVYRTLRQCVLDLEQQGQLVRVEEEVDAYLQVAEIQRRVFQAGGPAILFERVKDCQFPMVSNLFGSVERTRFIFRDTLEPVRRLIELKVDPGQLRQAPLKYLWAGTKAIRMLPRHTHTGPVLAHSIKISQLPQLQSWPDDGGPYITLPIVYSEPPGQAGVLKSNLGMYRIQLAGNEYRPDQQIGLHYQIHRGIGVHHAAALQAKEPFRVNIFVGGTPAMSVAAVMPLPEGLSELTFAGALAGHRIPMIRQPNRPAIYSEADFCITGVVESQTLPEGPFGDHLGYYSLAHQFPVLRVERVYHRRNAIWPFTVVGRPPQEDTMFGELIHELTGPVIPTVVYGVQAVNAVDAAGVHPLMLAIGSERYVPFRDTTQPQEILTQANAILGQGQMSLAKYLMIADGNDAPQLDVNDIAEFLQFVLRRIDPARDCHFQTCTTIDTLDYSGHALNEGSKLVLAAAGPAQRSLPTELTEDLQLPAGFDNPQICLPGIVAVQAPTASSDADGQLAHFCQSIDRASPLNQFPLVVLVDDSRFVAESLNNFLWVTFTRSDPAVDIDGVDSFTQDKHWGCRGSLVIDARRKPRHAPLLVEEPQVTAAVDAMAARGGPLARWL
jgi:4-hydroxy-3-polyprenylbenzoate decarboxylase